MENRIYHFGLIGYPLGHSLSPRIHTAALKAVGLTGDYRLYPVPSFPDGEKMLIGLLDALRHGDLDGFNITIPHKQFVVPLLDGLTSRAKNMGAVNTIYREGSCLIGENTDAPGFAMDLSNAVANFPRKAIVLGAGGAARAVVYALIEGGCEVYVVARRIRQAEEIVRQYRNNSVFTSKLHAISLDTGSMKLIMDDVDLIVNATPLGMFPDVEDSPWPENLLYPEKAFVYDTVYNPSETKLIVDARCAGLLAVSGLGMLIQQAGLAFECWTGISAPIHEMRMAVEVDFPA